MGCFLRIWGTLTSSNWSWNVSTGFPLVFMAAEVLCWIVGFEKCVPFSKMFRLSKSWKNSQIRLLDMFSSWLLWKECLKYIRIVYWGENTKKNKTGNINYKNDTDLKRVFKIACQNYFLKIYVFSSVCFSILFHGCFGNRGKKEKRGSILISTARSQRAENLHMIFKSHKNLIKINLYQHYLLIKSLIWKRGYNDTKRQVNFIIQTTFNGPGANFQGRCWNPQQHLNAA